MKLVPMFALAASACLVAATTAQPQGGKAQSYPDTKPALGAAAPDFTLTDRDGKEFQLKDHFGKRPVVIEFGSYS